MKDKFFEDIEKRNKKFWKTAEEGWDIFLEIVYGAAKLILIIVAIPFAFIGICKKWLKK